MNPQDAYRVDRRADVDNLRYQKLYRLDVPEYRQFLGIEPQGSRHKRVIKWTQKRLKKKKIVNPLLQQRRYYKLVNKACSNDNEILYKNFKENGKGDHHALFRSNSLFIPLDKKIGYYCNIKSLHNN